MKPSSCLLSPLPGHGRQCHGVSLPRGAAESEPLHASPAQHPETMAYAGLQGHEMAPAERLAMLWAQRCRRYLDEGREEPVEHTLTAYFNPGSPLFLATIPSARDIGPASWEAMLPRAYRSPGNELICLLYRLQEPLGSVAELRARAREWARLLQDVEMELLQRCLDAFAATGEFDQARYGGPRLAYETLRRTGLLLVSVAHSLQAPTALSYSRQDHALMSLLMLDFERLAKENPEVALWSLCIGGPFVSGDVRAQVLTWLAAVAARLGLHSWHEAREFLQSQLYYPAIQDQAGPQLWKEMAGEPAAAETVMSIRSRP